MVHVDLTPFGFTSTESSAYGALVAAGPSSGYAVAKELTIARANAYQALDGLVAKRAAEVSGEEPRLYRAMQPSAILARVSRDSASKLEELERQVKALEGSGAPDTVQFRSDGEFQSLLLRVAVREELLVTVLAPSDVLQQNLPVWRTRLANDRPTSLSSIGPIPDEFPATIDATIEVDAALAAIGVVPTIVVAGGAAILGAHDGPSIRGFWTSDSLLVAAARGIVLSLQE